MANDYKALSQEAEELLKDKDKLEKTLQKVEKKLSSIPLVGSALSYVPLMVSLVRAYIKGEYKEIPVTSIISIIVALIYIVSPVDIIPDVLPGIGYLDDAVVVAGCLALVKTDVEDYKLWREESGHVFNNLADEETIKKETAPGSKIFEAFFKGKKGEK